MVSASLSLSLPRLGWKSTSTPRSLNICTAAGDSASEMRTFGLDMGVILHTLPWRGRVGAKRRGGVNCRCEFNVRRARRDHPTPTHHSDASTLPLQGRVARV